MLVTCTTCGQKLKADDSRAGRVVNCPKCGQAVRLVAATTGSQSVPTPERTKAMETVLNDVAPGMPPSDQTVEATDEFQDDTDSHKEQQDWHEQLSPVARDERPRWLVRAAVVLALAALIAQCVILYQLRAASHEHLAALTKEPPIVAWEYQIISISDSIFDLQMERQGGYGWELVFARRAIDSDTDVSKYECIFKRPSGTVSAIQLEVEKRLK